MQTQPNDTTIHFTLKDHPEQAIAIFQWNSENLESVDVSKQFIEYPSSRANLKHNPFQKLFKGDWAKSQDFYCDLYSKGFDSWVSAYFNGEQWWLTDWAIYDRHLLLAEVSLHPKEATGPFNSVQDMIYWVVYDRGENKWV